MTGLAIDVAAWSSPWRRRSPADKSLLCLGLCGCALVLPPVPACPLVLLVVVVVALGPARIPAGVLARIGRLPAAFILVTAVPVAVSVRVGDGPFVEVTRAGLVKAGELALHGLAGSATVLLLAMTTPVVDLLPRLRSLGVPVAVIEVALVMYRMLFALLDSVHAITQAQAARLGYAGWRSSTRSAALLTAAVLTRAFDRARRLEDGLTGRGSDGSLVVVTETQPSSWRFVAGCLACHLTLVVGSLAVGPLVASW